MRFARNRMLLLRPLSDGGRPAVASLILVLLADACVPAGIAAGLALLVGTLSDTPHATLSAAATPLLVFGAILILGHLAEAVAGPLEFLVQTNIDGAHRARLANLAIGSTSIGPLETPEVQALIRQAKADPEGGSEFTPGDAAIAQLRWLAGLFGAAAACAVLARYSLWLIPLVLIPAAANRMLRGRRFFVVVDKWRLATQEELHADVWRKATVSPSEGKDVRIYGLTDWMVRRMQKHIAAGNAPLWDYRMQVARSQWLPFLLVALGLVPAYVLVTLGAVRGDTTTAVQAAVLAAGWSLFQVLGTAGLLYRMSGGLQVLGATQELHAKLSAPGAVGGTPVTRDRPPLIKFEKIGFGYPGTDRPILTDLDLEVRPGELLALVGMNGAGKSTVIKLLTRLYEPTSGRVTADGEDIAQLDPQLWRDRVSVVFQDFVKYPLSAADNVALGAGARPDLLDAAAKASGFAEVVAGLPAGWETPLSRSRTGGVDLSGGQWQQVVLTRALYAAQAEARVLLLDEPTAHLDVQTEFEVFQRLAEHRGQTSVVLISHRLSTVRQADRIVLLDQGRITESGTHDELMALGGAYAAMFAIQAERFQQGYDDRMEEERV